METLKDRFSTYIVCLTSDPYNLYDYEYGIMVEGKIRDEYVNSPEYISGKLTQPANFTQQGRDWERDVYVEILSPDGEQPHCPECRNADLRACQQTVLLQIL